MNWIKWPYWLRGGLAGAIVMAAVLLILYFSGNGDCPAHTGFCVNVPWAIVILPAFLLLRLAPFFFLDMPDWGGIVVALLLWLIFSFLVGAIAVYELDRFKTFHDR